MERPLHASVGVANTARTIAVHTSSNVFCDWWIFYYGRCDTSRKDLGIQVRSTPIIAREISANWIPILFVIGQWEFVAEICY